MDQQQANHSKPTSIVDVGDKDLRSNLLSKKKNQEAAIMSEEEWKIQGELERDLEAQIKDEIYQLALRLHRLYQQRRERINAAKDMLESDDDHNMNDKTLSEVNISIKMEGETKIEIKETKKEAHPDHHKKSAAAASAALGLPLQTASPSRSTCRTNNGQGRVGFNGGKQFDWAKSLRAAPCPSIINRKEKGFCMNLHSENKRNLVSASRNKN